MASSDLLYAESEKKINYSYLMDSPKELEYTFIVSRVTKTTDI